MVWYNCTPEKRTVLAAALGMRLDLAGGGHTISVVLTSRAGRLRP